MILRPTALICPGQGSQHPGMLSAVPTTTGVDRLLDAAEAMTDLDLRALDRLADASDLAETRVAQPLLYLVDWAWGRSLMDRGLDPIAVAGHSLGEFAALALADVFSVEAGLQLVVERSALMATAAAVNPGTMSAVIGLSGATVEDAIRDIEGASLANDNCPGQIVISGTVDGVAEATSSLEEAGAKRVVALSVSGGFHSPLMADAASAFREVLSGTDFSDARIPIVQNTAPDAPATDADTIRENLAAQMTGPVRWTESMATLRSLGADLLVEVGPGSVLAGLARRCNGVGAISVEGEGVDAVMQEAQA